MESPQIKIEQHDWHVREWRMIRAQWRLIYNLHAELQRFASMRVT